MTQRAAESVLAARFMPLAFPAVVTTITRFANRRCDVCAQVVGQARGPSPEFDSVRSADVSGM